MKRAAVGGKFGSYFLHIGEGKLLEYPLNTRNYHKYPSSTAIEKSILEPKSCSIAEIHRVYIDDLYKETEIIWEGYIRKQAFEILLNYFNYINKQIQI